MYVVALIFYYPNIEHLTSHCVSLTLVMPLVVIAIFHRYITSYVFYQNGNSTTKYVGMTEFYQGILTNWMLLLFKQEQLKCLFTQTVTNMAAPWLSMYKRTYSVILSLPPKYPSITWPYHLVQYIRLTGAFTIFSPPLQLRW